MKQDYTHSVISIEQYQSELPGARKLTDCYLLPAELPCPLLHSLKIHGFYFFWYYSSSWGPVTTAAFLR